MFFQDEEVRMTYPRKSLISIKETPYYHCVARCVRRAWLWGVDEYAGKDYSHRKQWVIDRLQELSYVFSIETCAYAVMSNHYHLVLYVDIARALGWSDEEVVRRWKKLFCVPPLVQRYVGTETISRAERDAARDIIATWRARLMDISWFMKSMNEHLARRANIEDGVTGRFWEGRFKSQALLDEAGLLTAMAYVDLNPIRAGIANTPESSDFTSIYDRIQVIKKQPNNPVRLRKFAGQASKDRTLPCSQEDYFTLVDWTGRALRGDKRGHINQALPPILTRLNIDPTAWEETMRPQGNVFGRAMGQLDHLRLHAKALGQSWVRGLRQAERMYRAA
jgi:REP element-mobilizing transposase RayT